MPIDFRYVHFKIAIENYCCTFSGSSCSAKILLFYFLPFFVYKFWIICYRFYCSIRMKVKISPRIFKDRLFEDFITPSFSVRQKEDYQPDQAHPGQRTGDGSQPPARPPPHRSFASRFSFISREINQFTENDTNWFSLNTPILLHRNKTAPLPSR